MRATSALDRSLRLVRQFDAPPEMVFEAWTNPAELGWFFNPEMETSEPISVDLRIGGAWRQHMVIDRDTQYFTGGVYREIVPHEKLVFTWGATGGWPSIDDNILVTLRFAPVGHRTEMSFHLQFPDHYSEQQESEWKALMGNGWGMTIDRLVAQLRK